MAVSAGLWHVNHIYPPPPHKNPSSLQILQKLGQLVNRIANGGGKIVVVDKLKFTANSTSVLS